LRATGPQAPFEQPTHSAHGLDFDLSHAFAADTHAPAHLAKDEPRLLVEAVPVLADRALLRIESFQRLGDELQYLATQ